MMGRVETSDSVEFKVLDSGKRQEFETGARRDVQEGKPKYGLLPLGALRRWAEHMTKGAAKYGDRNWEKGIPVSRFVESMLRHVYLWMEGEKTEDHLAAVLFNVGGIMETQKRVSEGKLPASLDDWPAQSILSESDIECPNQPSKPSTT